MTEQPGMKQMCTSNFITAQEEELVRKPLEEACNLPPRTYADPQIYELECEKIFARSWLYACRSSAMTEPGSYFSREIAGEPVVLVRGDDGVLRAFSNVCRHRSRKIAEGSGNCKRGGLVCPYHAWNYDQTGSLRHAPGMDKVKNFDKSTISLPEFRVEEWLGFIFVNFDKDADALAPQLSDLEELLAPYRLGEASIRNLINVDANWNWKASVDAFSEALHQIMVHKNTAELRVPSSKAVYGQNYGIHSHFWLNSVDGKPFAPLFPEPEDFDDEQLSRGLVVNIYPYFHLLVYPTYTLLLDFELEKVDKHRFIFDTLLSPAASRQSNVDELFEGLAERMSVIVGEDEGACSGLPGGHRSRFAIQGRLSDQEAVVHQFHLWVLNQVTGD